MARLRIPITKPTLDPYAAYAPAFKKIIESGMLTNDKNVQELEKRVARYLGVKHAVAVNSCTAGLILVLKGLGVKGEVIMPSFTFSASGHAVAWNGLTPVFADIDPDTYELDSHAVEKLITKRTGAIMPTQIFGYVCDPKPLQTLAKKHHLKLVFDAAHALGSSRDGIKAGNFGDAEVFSCSPTKLMTTAEGGIVATNDDKLAAFVRLGRTYGDDGSYDTAFHGLNARMSEFHGAVGLRSLAKLDMNVRKRNALAAYYEKALHVLDPRIEFQHIPKGVTTTFKDFSLFIDPKKCGYTRDELHDHLAVRGIMSKKYFHPPLHMQRSHKMHHRHELPVTERVSTNVLSLPMYSHMKKREVDEVIAAIRHFYAAKKTR